MFTDDFWSDLRTFAFHEAGHTVLREKYGSHVCSVTIDGRIPLTGFSGRTTAQSGITVEIEGLCALGGYATTLILFDRGELPEFGYEREILAWFSQGTGSDVTRYFVSNGVHSDCSPNQLQQFHDAARNRAVPILEETWENVEGIADVVFGCGKQSIQDFGVLPLREQEEIRDKKPNAPYPIVIQRQEFEESLEGLTSKS